MTAAESDLVSEVARVAPAERQRARTAQSVAAGIALELRNPVTAIASAARLLRYRVIEDPVFEKNVGRILREAERLNALVSALLEYGSPEPLRFAAGDPDDLWTQLLHAERGVLESKALIVRHTPATPRVSCALDAGQMTHACSHLLSNAIDASPEGSDLTLTSTALPNGDWRCALTNGGPPVAPDTLARAFDLLVSTKPGRAGVGLALVSRIVAEHGGAIALDSNPDVGTTATLTLPAARAHG